MLLDLPPRTIVVPYVRIEMLARNERSVME
jgi:hypothetical protein